MNNNRYNLHELLFSGDSEEERMLREDARVKRILEDISFKLEGDLLTEGWFSDLFGTVGGWFSSWFGWGDDDEGTDPNEWSPSKQQLTRALAVGNGPYSKLVKKWQGSKKGGGDAAGTTKAAWDPVENIANDEFADQQFDNTGEARGNMAKQFADIGALSSWVNTVKSDLDAATDSAFKMNSAFGDAMIKAINATTVEDFLPKPEKTDENRRHSLRILLEQGNDDEAGVESGKLMSTPDEGSGDKKAAKKAEKPAVKKASKEALAAAEKKRALIISKMTQTSKEVFKNKAMAEIQCAALATEVVKGPFVGLDRLINKTRSSKKGNWASQEQSKKTNRSIIKTALGMAKDKLMGEADFNQEEGMLGIGMIINKAYISKDPVKYYTALIAAHKKSE